MVFSKHFQRSKGHDKRPAKRQHSERQDSGPRKRRFERSKESASKKRPPKNRHSKPSQAALMLSSKLKDFSKRKDLKQALEFYWDKSNDGIRDGHHACILVDCCSRCGSVEVRKLVRGTLETTKTHSFSSSSSGG